MFTCVVSGWRWFLLWSLPGIGLGFGVGAVGIVTVPAALVAGLLLTQRIGFHAEALGTLVGVAAVLLLVAWLNRGPGGFDALHWLAAALAFAAAGVGGYALARRRRV